MVAAVESSTQALLIGNIGHRIVCSDFFERYCVESAVKVPKGKKGKVFLDTS